MTLRPDLTVAAVVERDGQFLLVEERVGNRMVFNQPAGHVERGEQFIEAVIRETLEETAWAFRPEALIGVYLWEQVEKQKSFLRVVYSGEVTHHHADRQLDRGIERALWLDRDQIVARSARLRSPLVLQCIDDYLEGTRHPLDVAKNVVKDGVLSPEARARTLEHPAINRLI